MTKDMFDWEEDRSWQDKCWGQVRHVFESDDVAISILKVNKGFRCSRHYHRHRKNQFIVISGKIEVLEWATFDQSTFPHPTGRLELDAWSLNPHTVPAGVPWAMNSHTVPAGVPHMFRVLEDGIVVEVYSRDSSNGGNGPVSINDIVRFDEGGVDDT